MPAKPLLERPHQFHTTNLRSHGRIGSICVLHLPNCVGYGRVEVRRGFGWCYSTGSNRSGRAGCATILTSRAKTNGKGYGWQRNGYATDVVINMGKVMKGYMQTHVDRRSFVLGPAMREGLYIGMSGYWR